MNTHVFVSISVYVWDSHIVGSSSSTLNAIPIEMVAFHRDAFQVAQTNIVIIE